MCDRMPNDVTGNVACCLLCPSELFVASDSIESLAYTLGFHQLGQGPDLQFICACSNQRQWWRNLQTTFLLLNLHPTLPSQLIDPGFPIINFLKNCFLLKGKSDLSRPQNHVKMQAFSSCKKKL